MTERDLSYYQRRNELDRKIEQLTDALVLLLPYRGPSAWWRRRQLFRERDRLVKLRQEASR